MGTYMKQTVNITTMGGAIDMPQDIVITTHGVGLPCAAETFIVNGIDAEVEDFGECKDLVDEAYKSNCKNRQFVKALPTDEVLAKYGLNLKQYAAVCAKLETTFAIGWCTQCT